MSGRASDSGFDRDNNTHAADDPVDHLWQAAHEFLAAARAVIDAADAVVLDQQRRAGAPRPPRLRRIDVE
ncbi:MAG: hypothetical protein ACLPVY_24370 [Acidimicrobiia bacterium]